MAFSLINRPVFRLNSSFNGEIIVKEQFGQHTLYVNGIPQSGGIVRDIWRKGIKKLPELGRAPRILLLGLGGGSVIFEIKKRWPKAGVTAIELDPEIIIVGRTYFGLDKLAGLEIINEDAEKVIKKKKHQINKSKFDLILVDIYIGKDQPLFTSEESFIEGLKRLLNEKGILVFNHLLDKQGKEMLESHIIRLKKLFPRIETLDTASNELIFGYRK